MKQLRLFPDDHASVRIVPQPIRDAGFSPGDWQWPFSQASCVVTTNPRTSKSMLTHSPYQVGAFYDSRVIVNVKVEYTRARGWVWILKLREPKEDDFSAWWSLLKAVQEPPEIRCQHCGDRENGVKMISAMTAYHAEPGEPDPNPPLILCKDCREDYEEYWTERWNEYYSSRL